MAHRSLVALLAAACCGVAVSCDNLADLLGRLKLESSVSSTADKSRLRLPGSGFVAPASVGFSFTSRHAAHMLCARQPSWGAPGFTGKEQITGVGGTSSWTQVESKGRVRSALSSVSMSGKNRARIQPTVVRPTGIAQRPSHQVGDPAHVRGCPFVTAPPGDAAPFLLNLCSCSNRL